jgi:hypothetical protein
MRPASAKDTHVGVGGVGSVFGSRPVMAVKGASSDVPSIIN